MDGKPADFTWTESDGALVVDVPLHQSADSDDATREVVYVF